MGKITEFALFPEDWNAARPELVRKQFELVNAVNPLVDGRMYQTRTFTAAGTMNGADGVILANATAGAMTVTALPADEAFQKVIRVKKIDASANNVLVKAAGSDTFEGVTTITLAAQYASVVLYSSGSSTWWRF